MSKSIFSSNEERERYAQAGDVDALREMATMNPAPEEADKEQPDIDDFKDFLEDYPQFETEMLQIKQALYTRLAAEAEKYEVGSVWSDEHSRFVNGLVEAVPLSKIKEMFSLKESDI